MWKAASFGALTLALLAVAGCGGNDSDDDGSPSPGGATATSAPAQSPTAAASPTPAVLDAGAILEKNRNSVVKVLATVPGGEGSGTGVVWQDSNHVLTNAHVVVGAGAIKVVDPLDGSRSWPARVVALSSCDDVALLSVDRAENLKPASFADSNTVRPGDHVVALGYPGTLSAGPNNAIVTEGTISRIKATFEFSGQRDLLQHTAPINPGNSGGPLFNMAGQVIGLNSYAARGRQAENYAISMNEVKVVAEDLEAGKNLTYLGITIEPNDPDFAFENDLAYTNGLVILAKDPGSPADEADPFPLEVGYIIFQVNGVDVTNVGEFCDIIRSRSSGETLNIRFGAYDENDEPYDNFQYKVKVP
jgi:S1-C subfamily serine protease